ncbi:MAG TPA: response regulator transcription factor [Solirubrobacteraceae bacterium]|nr:response regulator transcription factor [Solirubrobacteraceae bacterium]
MRGLVANVKVMVVDDQEVFRDVARELITATDGFALVGEATSGESALQAMDELMPDLVVMDVRMPGMGGIDAADALLRRYPDRVVLLVSIFELTAPPPVSPSGRAVPFVRKAALGKEVLRDVWERYAPRRPVARARPLHNRLSHG